MIDVGWLRLKRVIIGINLFIQLLLVVPAMEDASKGSFQSFCPPGDSFSETDGQNK